MQRYVVEGRVYVLGLHARDQFVAQRRVRQDEIIEVTVAAAGRWNCRYAQASVVITPHCRVVDIPGLRPVPLEAVDLFQLAKQKSSNELPRQERRPDIDPGVFIGKTAKEV